MSQHRRLPFVLRASLLLALVLPWFAACSSTEVKATPPQGDWALASLAGTARSGASLAFMDGSRVAGRGGCNGYSATVELGAADALRFGPVAATKMACVEGDAMQLEGEFFAMLAAVRGYRHDPARRLQLLDGQGAVLAEFAPARASNR